MSLRPCVLGVIGVDMILCYYILQEQFFHPHPDGFYPTCSGLEGSSWGRDAASQTTSAQHDCAFSRAKKKIQVHNNSLKLTELRDYDACSVTGPLDYQQRWVKLPLLCLADGYPRTALQGCKQRRGDSFAVTRSGLRPPVGKGIGAITWHKFSGTASGFQGLANSDSSSQQLNQKKKHKYFILFGLNQTLCF